MLIYFRSVHGENKKYVENSSEEIAFNKKKSKYWSFFNPGEEELGGVGIGVTDWPPPLLFPFK